MKKILGVVMGMVVGGVGAGVVSAVTYLPLQTFDGQSGQWLYGNLGWTKLYSGDLQVTTDTALTGPAIDGSTFTGSEGAEKLPFVPASGNETYVLTCKAVGTDMGYSQGVVGYGWSAGWWWNGTNSYFGGWTLDLSALGGGSVNYGLTETAGQVLTLILVVDQAHMQAWGIIKSGSTTLVVTPKATITSAAVDGVVVGSQNQGGVDVDDIEVTNVLPRVTYLPLQTFDGQAGQWLYGNLGWIKLYSGDLQVTSDTALNGPAIDGSTFTGSEGAEKLPFTMTTTNETYVLICKAVGGNAGYSQGVVGYGWSAGWWWNGTNPYNGGWTLELRGLGGTAVTYGLNETAGRVLTLQLIVDQANLEAWGVIREGETTLLVTPKTAITDAAVDGVVVGAQNELGVDVDDIMVDNNVPPIEIVATPTFDPDGGSYAYTTAPKVVTIDCATPGATIRYTLDGSDPNETSDSYLGPITVDHTLTLKAKAWLDGYNSSAVKSATYAFVLREAQIPQTATVTIDGTLADWPVAAEWSPAYVLWNGDGLTSTTQAKFAWNDASDLLYVAIRTTEAGYQPGGHAVIGFSKSIDGIPNTGIGSTQLCFDTVAGGNLVTITNEIDYYTVKYSIGWPQAGIEGVEAKYSYDGGTGFYTYEIAVPLWQDWRTGQPRVKNTLAVGDVVYLYSVMEKTLDGAGDPPAIGAHGTSLSWYGNPAFYNGAFDKAVALTLAGGTTTPTPTPTPTPGDANKDGKVDVSDLGILAAHYGETAGATWETGDFNNDGKVDVSDLGILAAHYGSGTGDGLDFDRDAQAFGLSANAKAETPAASNLECGSAGLPLIAGLLLMGLLLVKLDD